MEVKKNKSIIGTLIMIALFIFVGGLITASITFSKKDDSVEINTKLWDIYFTEPMVDADLNNNIVINASNIDFSVDLRNGLTEYNFVTSINNDGDYNAKLSKISVTNFNDIVVGAIEEKTYTLGSFFNINLKYYEDNSLNSVKKNSSVSVGDLLKKGSQNKIEVIVSLKNNLNLNEAEKEILNNISTLNVSIKANYQQI